MKIRGCLQGVIALAAGIALLQVAAAQGSVYVMPLKANFISPSTVDQVTKLINIAEDNDASAAVIMLDTPGGRVDSMFEIMQLIYNSRVPVVVYVAPKGADAASAGAFITVASHIAAMAPGTAIGAAEPVQSSPDPQGGAVQPAPNKTKSYIIGRMESTANLTGRPVEPLVKFITANLVLTPNEALEEGVIDFIAETEADLLSQIVDFPIHGSLGDGSRPTVTLSGAEIFYVELSITEKFTNFMSDPTLSYILLMVGMYGLIFGLMSPGTYVPETLGAICIILALYGLGIVGANIVGILLLIMGMIFLFAEAATPTFGLFTVAAVICFIFGILFVPPRIGGDVIPSFYLPRQWYTTFTLTSLTLIAGFVAFFIFGMQYVVKGRNKPSSTGGDELMGMVGRTVGELNPRGQIRLRGELWSATSAEREPIPGKTEVRVVGRKGLTIIVERVEHGQD